MRVATWNVAAVNNNPFEYWLTHPDPEYARLMRGVEQFILEPGARDVPVGSVFSDAMFAELRERMDAEGWAGVPETEALWRSDFRERKIISGFLRDGTLGKKRLASMPDRFTNTITAADGSSHPRPSVINSFTGPMQTTREWWEQWLAFLFVEPLQLAGRDGAPSARRPAQLLRAIPASKYPELSAAEEAISLPLQTLCLALFDAILVHVLNTLAPGAWLPLKQQLVQRLVLGKVARTAELLGEPRYAGVGVFCLQEAGAALAHTLRAQLAPGRFVVAPGALDPSRDQNSLALLSAELFDEGSVQEVSRAVERLLPSSSLAPGDLLAFTVAPARADGGAPYLLASFHGDTNGLQTAPVLAALAAYAAGEGAEPGGRPLRLLLGLDANAHLGGDARTHYTAQQLEADCAAAGLLDCWPLEARWAGCLTTNSARTFLQPQLNKACPHADMATGGDRNPKVAARRGRARDVGPAGRSRARADGRLPLTAAYAPRPRARLSPRAAGPHSLLGGGLRGGRLLARQHGRRQLRAGARPARARLPVGPLHRARRGHPAGAGPKRQQLSTRPAPARLSTGP